LIGVVFYVIQRALPPTEGVRFGAFTHGNAAEIGLKLFEDYLLPFEVTSILILVALIGAIVLARKEIH
jgi:NADH-quinone oxidoreductase subunit J